MHVTPTSPYRGVTYDRRKGRFMAQITVDGTRYFLGYFSHAEDARDVYAYACSQAPRLITRME